MFFVYPSSKFSSNTPLSVEELEYRLIHTLAAMHVIESIWYANCITILVLVEIVFDKRLSRGVNEHGRCVS